MVAVHIAVAYTFNGIGAAGRNFPGQRGTDKEQVLHGVAMLVVGQKVQRKRQLLGRLYGLSAIENVGVIAPQVSHQRSIIAGDDINLLHMGKSGMRECLVKVIDITMGDDGVEAGLLKQEINPVAGPLYRRGMVFLKNTDVEYCRASYAVRPPVFFSYRFFCSCAPLPGAGI